MDYNFTGFELTLLTGGIGVAGALIGNWIGHHLSKSRDRRKEFNDLVNPIRIDLITLKSHPQCTIKGEYMIAFNLIREQLPFWRRKGFDRAISSYHKTKSEYNQSFQPDGMGGQVPGDKTEEYGLLVSHTADDLLKYLKPK